LQVSFWAIKIPEVNNNKTNSSDLVFIVDFVLNKT
jgi:hypothetical protein